MTRAATTLVHASVRRASAAIKLVAASHATARPYNPRKTYTPAELEPYDALCDRFVRAVETAIKFFRTVELLEYAEQSDTVRDLLNRVAKRGLISSPELWLCMRDARNRIVHDYLPEDLHALHNDLQGPFAAELMRLADQLPRYDAATAEPQQCVVNHKKVRKSTARNGR